MASASVNIASPVRPHGAHELDDARLNACKSGDSEAQRAFVLCYQHSVFALLSRLLGRGPDVEDLAQETFIRALRALPSFEWDSSVPPSHWLLTIAARLAFDHHRRHRTACRAHAALHLAPALPPPTPEFDLTRQRLRVALAEAIDGLSLEQRAALVMTEFHGLSVAETARALSVNENTIKTRLFRARAQLSAALTEYRDRHD